MARLRVTAASHVCTCVEMTERNLTWVLTRRKEGGEAGGARQAGEGNEKEQGHGKDCSAARCVRNGYIWRSYDWPQPRNGSCSVGFGDEILKDIMYFQLCPIIQGSFRHHPGIIRRHLALVSMKQSCKHQILFWCSYIFR